MPFGLKNDAATYQRLVDTVFEGQIGRNLEAYVDDMVIKSKRELEMTKDVEETLLTLKKVNMKLNPKKCSFGMEEGTFLGYIVTSEGIRANPKKAEAIVYKQKGLSLDNRGRRSISGNEEIDSETTNLNGSKEGRRTHGLSISDQRSSQCRFISGKTGETSPNPLHTMAENNSTQIKASGPNDTLAEGKSGEEQKAPEAKAPKNLGTKADLWKLYTD
ncbi:reverse transcriptase domain-containing protein [Tanacetum coccineum]